VSVSGGIEFPTAICPDTTPHGKHRIAGSWRQECPGVAAKLEITVTMHPAQWGCSAAPVAPGEHSVGDIDLVEYTAALVHLDLAAEPIAEAVKAAVAANPSWGRWFE
jgi:hypothetical protein